MGHPLLEIHKATFERVTITCPMENRRLALDRVYDNGYFVKSSGPKSNGDYTVDHSIFQVVAEKEIT